MRLEDRINPFTFVWDDGGATDKWSDAGNWAGNFAPAAGMTGTVIVFQTTDSSTFQDIPDLTIATLRFDPGADITLTLNADLRIDGAGATVNISDSTGLNDVVGSGDLILTGTTVLIETTATTGQLGIAADITGTEQLVKRGTGTLELSTTNANTYIGPTFVLDGILRLNTATANAGLSATIDVGDGSGGSQSAQLQLLGTFELPDSSIVTVRSDGVLSIAGGQTEDFTNLTLTDGRVAVEAGGTLRIRDGGTVTADGPVGSLFTNSISGDGSLELASDTRFTVSSTLSLGLVVAGTGGVVKYGQGTLDLFGNNTYTGQTSVFEGSLFVNGNQPSNSAGVSTGGTLGGFGTVGLLTATGGTLIPFGLRAGNTAITGVNLSPQLYGPLSGFPYTPGSADRLSVTGFVSLNGAILTPTLVNDAPSAGEAFVLIDNDGTDAVVGTFAGLPEGATLTISSQPFTLTYRGGDGNDVVLSAAGPAVVPGRLPSQVGVGGSSDGRATTFVPSGSGGLTAGSTLALFSNAALVRTAQADVNGDGTLDVVGVTGPGVQNQLVVLDGKGGTELVRFSPYEPSFRSGLFVAAGDLDGDGKAEVVVTPDLDGGPIAVAYGGSKLAAKVSGDAAQILRFKAILGDDNYRGGVRPAVGDVDGDGRADLMFSAGLGGGPRIALFSGAKVAAAPTTTISDSATEGLKLVSDFFAFEDSQRAGAFVALGDVTGDGRAELVFGGGPAGGSRIRIFEAAAVLAAGTSITTLDGLPGAAQLSNFIIGDPNVRAGVRVTMADLDGDSRADLVTASGTNQPARLRAYLGRNLQSGNAEPTGGTDVSVLGGGVLLDGVYVG